MTKRHRKKVNNAKEEVKEEINKIIKKRKEKRQFTRPEKKLVTFEEFGGIEVKIKFRFLKFLENHQGN